MDKTMELCSLMGKFPKLLHSFFSDKLSSFGVSGIVVPYVVALHKNDGIGILDLSKKVGLDKANTSRVIRDMSQNGLVKQKRDKLDKRLIHLHLTDSGMEVLQVICGALKELGEILFEGISEKEKEYIHQIINKIRLNACNITNSQGSSTEH